MIGDDVIREEPKLINNFNGVLTKTFFRMFLGLLATAIMAFVTYKTNIYMEIPYGVLATIEIAVVLIFSLLFRKLSPMAVTILFYTYAFINGMTFAVIFAIFDIGTIFYAFTMTAVLFGALAFVGYKTKKDMSKFGNILIVALVVGLIFSIVNLIISNSIIDIALDWVILLIFCGLTAYDINKIKVLQNNLYCDEEKLYIYSAMQLYLDFINIFIRILSIMGRRRN